MDTLITDVDEGTLHSEISQGFGIQYLEQATGNNAIQTADYIDGYLYGSKLSPILLCVVHNGDKVHCVIFIVDPGAACIQLGATIVPKAE